MTHATASDFPGWPTPPRVRDIAKTPGSWGRVFTTSISQLSTAVAQDELGRLWADGDAIPRYSHIQETENCSAYLYWTEHGLGVHLPARSYGNLGNVSSLDMRPDQWIPIAVVAQELPGFATATDPPGRISR